MGGMGEDWWPGGVGQKQFAITRWLSMLWVARLGGLRQWRRMRKESVWTSGWQAVGGVECSVGGRLWVVVECGVGGREV